MKLKFTTLIIALVFLSYSCKKDDQVIEPDSYQISQEIIDGISYKCITIGDQVWMAENLKTRLDGGRAEGSMTFKEPIITITGKESLELKALVNQKILERLDDGVFITDNVINAAAEFFVKDDLMKYFFNRNTMSWAQYVDMNLTFIWPRYYNSIAFNLVRHEVTRLFEEEKKLIILAAADQNYLKEFGNLYNFEAAKKVVPQGWRIPSDEDWMKLERAMGMSEADIQKIDQWRGNVGRLLKSNGVTESFNAKMGGAYIYGFSQYSDNFVNKGTRGYWWTSTKDVTSAVDSTYYIRSLRFDNDQMLRGTTRINPTNSTVVEPPAYSLRLVKDK